MEEKFSGRTIQYTAVKGRLFEHQTVADQNKIPLSIPHELHIRRLTSFTGEPNRPTVSFAQLQLAAQCQFLQGQTFKVPVQLL